MADPPIATTKTFPVFSTVVSCCIVLRIHKVMCAEHYSTSGLEIRRSARFKNLGKVNAYRSLHLKTPGYELKPFGGIFYLSQDSKLSFSGEYSQTCSFLL